MPVYDKILNLVGSFFDDTQERKLVTIPKKLFYEPGGMIQGMYLTMPSPSLSYDEIGMHYTGICTNTRARSVAQRDIAAQTVTIDGKVEDLPTDHYISILFKQPQPGQTITAFMQLVSKWLDYTGNCFIYLNRAGGDVPVQMWILPTNLITIKGGATIDETKYIYTGQKTQEFEYKDIVHIKRSNPSTDENENFHYGTSPELTAALTAIGIQRYYAQYLTDLFKRGGSNPVIFELLEDNSMSTGNDSGQSRIESIREGAKGLLPEGANYGIFEGVKIVPLQSSSTRVSTSESESQTIKTVCAAFGLGKDYLEKNKSSENGTIVTQSDILENTIFPIIKEILQAIQYKLQQYEPNLKLSYDDKIDVSPDAQLARDEMEIVNGVITVNEYRLRRGLPAMESANGDLTTVEITAQNTQTDNIPTEPATQNSIEPNAQVGKSLSMAEYYKTYIWKKVDTFNQKETVKLTKTLKTYMTGLQARTKANVNAQVDSQAKSEVVFDIEINPFPLDPEKKQASDDTEDDRDRTAIGAGVLATDSVNHKPSDVPMTSIRGKQQKKSSGKITQGVTTIHKELQKNLQGIVNDYKGVSAKELKNKLNAETDRKFDGQYKQSRINNIAQTTTTTTVSGMQRDIFKDLGFGIKWLSMRDAKVRDSHRDLDGTSPDKEGLFNSPVSSGYGPGEMFLAKDSCNCRCQIVAVTLEGKIIIGFSSEGKNIIKNYKPMNI